MKLTPNTLIKKEEIKSSSSDNIYEVNLYDNCISCNCPAGGKKSLCKHMVKVLHDNIEILQQKNPDFYNNIQRALTMKNDKYKNPEEFKKVLESIIFVDRKIAEKSHDNSISVSKHPERTESIRFRCTSEEKEFLKSALYDFRKYGKYNGTWEKYHISFTINLSDIAEYLEWYYGL